MKNTFFKDIFREIFHSAGRFLSIFLIAALGCGFFAGIKATMPDMKDTAKEYFLNNNLMDIRLASSIGIKYDDAEALSELDCIKGVMPLYSKDVYYNYNDENIVLKAISCGGRYYGDNNLNQLTVIEGRLPKNSGECVVEKKVNSPESFKIGESITLSDPDETKSIGETLVADTYKIVGIVVSPLYIGYKRDKTTVGSGTVHSNIFLLEQDFVTDYYTELHATVEGLSGYDPFSDEYKDKCKEYAAVLENELLKSVNKRFEKYRADAEEKIESQSAQVKSLKTVVNSTAEELLALKAGLEENIDSLEKKLKKAETNAQKLIYNSSIEQSKQTLEQVLNLIEAYENNDPSVKKKLKKDLAHARNELSDAKNQLASAVEPSVYSFTRFESDDYSSYAGDSEKVDMIARVFPVFFIIVAALVCLTTMTRMVEEHRIEIGTYKALGYSSGIIALKYLIYAAVPACLGSIVGVSAGLQVFPYIIYDSYKILYNIPNINTPFKPVYCTLCTLAALACTSAAVVYAMIRELRASPSQLMRPKSPPPGKRIWLEKITFIWNRLGFLTKVTFRNLLRYKKRFFMTVAGVSGCTALIVTAFGLKNSIGAIIGKQFDNVFIYDAAVMVNSEKVSGGDDISQIIDSYDGVSDSLLVSLDTVSSENENSLQNNISLVVPSDSSRINDYINLHSRKTGETFSLDSSGVIVSEKLCELLELSEGDEINITSSALGTKTLKISHIIENYANHFIFINEDLYRQVYGSEPEYNFLYIHTDGSISSKELSSDIIKNDKFLGISFLEDTGKSFSDTLNSLNSIVFLLILCAGGLAIVVLYNLSNINVTERIREIATIKVLGFRDKEVSDYIIRENILSTAIGIAMGWILGVFLHRFVVMTSEVDLVMFDRNLVWWAFAVSAGLTALFSALVNFALHFKLKNVEMVESLKSIE